MRLDRSPCTIVFRGSGGPLTLSRWMLRWRLVPCLAVLLAAIGCSNERHAPPIPAFQEIRVEWFYCSLYPGRDDGIADCAETALPLRWDDPTGPKIRVAAKRLLASVKPRAQIWLLAGGPGGSGTLGLPERMEYIQKLSPEVEVYT